MPPLPGQRHWESVCPIEGPSLGMEFPTRSPKRLRVLDENAAALLPSTPRPEGLRRRQPLKKRRFAEARLRSESLRRRQSPDDAPVASPQPSQSKPSSSSTQQPLSTTPRPTAPRSSLTLCKSAEAANHTLKQPFKHLFHKAWKRLPKRRAHRSVGCGVRVKGVSPTIFRDAPAFTSKSKSSDL